jgi:serine/threonine-protein kinase
MSAANGHWPIGSTVAGCRLEAIAGSGPTGVVYRATQTDRGRPVAVKLLTSAFAVDYAYRDRFEREAWIAASIDHPNVLPVYDVGEVDGTPYVVTLWVEGTDLGGVLTDAGRLTPRHAVTVLRPAAEALAAAHERGLVHGDVKLTNVLLGHPPQPGGDEHVYLSDFGVACLDTAPERFDRPAGDEAADVYAFGCMLYQLLTGTAPFDGPSELPTTEAHRHGPIPSAAAIVPGTPRSLDAVIAKAMATRPEDRFRSASELARALARSLEDVLPEDSPSTSVFAGRAAPAADVQSTNLFDVHAAPADDAPTDVFPELAAPADDVPFTNMFAEYPSAEDPPDDDAPTATFAAVSATEPGPVAHDDDAPWMGFAAEGERLREQEPAGRRRPRSRRRFDRGEDRDASSSTEARSSDGHRLDRRLTAAAALLLAVAAMVALLGGELGSHGQRLTAARQPGDGHAMAPARMTTPTRATSSLTMRPASSPAPRTEVTGESGGLNAGQTVQLGGRPGAAAADQNGDLWVSLPGAQRVVKISAADHRTVAFGDSGSPSTITAGAGSVWVGGSAALVRLSSQSGRILTRVPLAGPPVALTADASGDGSVWAAESSGLIVHYSPAGEVLDQQQLTSASSSIGSGEGWTWAVNATGGGLSRIGEHSETPLRDGAGPDAVTFDEGVWTAQANGSVTRFDPRPGRLAVNAELPVAPSLDAIAATEHSPSVWAISSRTMRLYRISNSSAPSVTGTVTFRSPPVAVSAIGSSAWVTTQDGGVVQIDS